MGKRETEVIDGTVSRVNFAVGERVDEGETLPGFDTPD